MGTLGYDCLIIPGAMKSTTSGAFPGDYINANRFCGHSKGLAVIGANAAVGATVCSKCYRF